jgi:hypothetical protein
MGRPFLANLGVLPQDINRMPTAQAFPHAFNVNCKPLWDAAIAGLTIAEDDLAEHVWHRAIEDFVGLCVGKDLYPFSNLKQSHNDQILQVLTEARKAVVKFMNLSNILDYATIRTTSRSVEVNSLGFVLKVYGHIRLKDPTFERWLMKTPYPGFRIKHNERYIKQLSQTVTMVVYNEGASMPDRWHIGYEIVCRQFPDLPGRHLPSKADLEAFILKVIWMPVLKAHRPFKYHHRLI